MSFTLGLWYTSRNPVSVIYLSAVESGIRTKIRAPEWDFEPTVLVNTQDSTAELIRDIPEQLGSGCVPSSQRLRIGCTRVN